jgi:hypothetical protein
VNLRFRTVAVLGSMLAALAIAAACSNYGEGEVCNVENDSDDCKTDDGLICYAAQALTNTTSDRCCPVDRSTATHPACVTGNIAGTDGQAPANTGPSVSDAQVTTDSAAADGGATDAADQ